MSKTSGLVVYHRSGYAGGGGLRTSRKAVIRKALSALGALAANLAQVRANDNIARLVMPDVFATHAANAGAKMRANDGITRLVMPDIFAGGD